MTDLVAAAILCERLRASEGDEVVSLGHDEARFILATLLEPVLQERLEERDDD